MLWLLSVQRAGGMHAAALGEHVSASAISQQIARLEAEVGARLLDRHPQGVSLTPAGRVLAESAERIELELAESRRALSTLQGGPNGRVVVGGIKTVTVALLIPIIDRVHQRHAAIDVVVRQIEGDEAVRQLSLGDIDVLVLEAESPVGQSSRRGTKDRVLLDDPWLLAIPAQVKPPRSIEELDALTWLAVDERAAAHVATRRILEQIPEAQLSPHTYDDHDVAMAMVAAGLGVALAPRLTLAGHVPNEIRLIALPGLGTRRLLARVRTPRVTDGPELEIVLDELAATASEHYSIDR